MKFENYSCTRCDYKSASTILWGHKAYMISNKRYTLKSTPGWCCDCKTFCNREELPSLERILIKKCQITLLQTELNLINGRGLFMKIFEGPKKFFSKVCRVMAIRDELEVILKELSELTELYGKMLNRSSKPRCLNCSSENTFKVKPLHREYRLNEKGIRKDLLGIKHHDCGGDIISKCSGINLNMKINEVLYNLEGIKIPSNK